MGETSACVSRYWWCAAGAAAADATVATESDADVEAGGA